MNIIFGIFVTISTLLIILSKPSLFLTVLGTASEKAFTLSATLAGMYAFWMGIVRILERTPAMSKLERLVSPVVCRIFPCETAEVRMLITMNITANMLGAGGASTPLGISAIEKMSQNAKKLNATYQKERATKSMLMLFILNATSLQLIPTTIISLRESAGSITPASILFPTLIASTLATLLGVLLIAIFEK